LNSKKIAFAAIMGALGNTLAALSIGLTNAGQVGLDISHIATFIAAIYGGPYIGLSIGFIIGLVPGIYFGPIGGLAFLGLIGLPVGKALTGLTTGTIYKFFKVDRSKHTSLFVIPVALAGYVPEFLFTIFFFLSLVPALLGWPIATSVAILSAISVKAWIEIALMSILMGALVGNNGFNAFMANFFSARSD
jgi:predicted membrane protein